MNFSNTLLALLIAALLIVAAPQDCPEGCNDSPPQVGPLNRFFTCQQQKEFGQCNAWFMEGYCECTCETCDLLDVVMLPISPTME